MNSDSGIRASGQRKTSYFEKYRLELERISMEMKNKTQSLTNPSEKSTPIRQSNELAFQQQKIVSSPNIIAPRMSFKKSQVQAQLIKESSVRLSFGHKQQDLPLVESQTMKQVELLMIELELMRSKIAGLDQEINSKKRAIDSIKQVLESYSSDYSKKQQMSHAQKILAIETRMKYKKQLHQDELNKLMNEKNSKHAQNVELSKLIETLEEELDKINKIHQKSEEDESKASLEFQITKIKSQIAKISQQRIQIQQRINNQQQLKQISLNEYRRYAEVYKRQFLGKQISLSQDRIKQKKNSNRFVLNIQRKKLQVKDKKVELFLVERRRLQMIRAVEILMKQIRILKKQQEPPTLEKKFFFQV